MTGKEIYGANCKAVVQIQADEAFGNGFIVSADGIIMTANHVVTTRDSGLRQYAKDIKVTIHGGSTSYSATPLAAQVSDDQVNYDSALIKITASQLPTVTLGDWNEVDIGDRLTLLPSLRGVGCIVLEGIVARSASMQTGFGSKPVNTILFQSPVRNGFSGGPIFSAKGSVVGIVNTKIFGISPSLDDLRKKWLAFRTQGANVSFGGIDLTGSFLDLINNLDQNLVSGLGSAIAIDHAKQLQAQASKK